MSSQAMGIIRSMMNLDWLNYKYANDNIGDEKQKGVLSTIIW